VFWLTIWNGLRLGEAIFYWKTLAEYGAHPLYIAITGGVWPVAGFFLVWGLWQGKSWGWVAVLVGTVGYTGWYWFDRLVLQQPHANWPFVLVANIVCLLLILIILFSRVTRRYFKRDANDRKPKNPTIT
jgi:predicted permease